MYLRIEQIAQSYILPGLVYLNIPALSLSNRLYPFTFIPS